MLSLGLHGVKPSAVRLGVVLALFSFVGFESATTLGAEARNPLKTIPRAVVQSAFFTGLFFIVVRVPGDAGHARRHTRIWASLQRAVPHTGELCGRCARSVR